MTNPNPSHVFKKIPVILDTDIGDDIDDTWALGMMLHCPELDVKMVLSATENTVYRAKIIAKFLEETGRTDIAVAVGAPHKKGGSKERQAKWLGDYDLSRYPGTVHEDGIEAAAREILHSAEPITLVSIAPLGNVAELLARHPEIAPRTRFVGMQGSLDLGYEGKPGAAPEWNVVCDVPAARTVFSAPWLSAVVTPVDSCGLVTYRGSDYDILKNSPHPTLRAVMENYRVWADYSGVPNAEETTTVLFDTVAIHLAYSTRYLRFETTGIEVTDDGRTVRNAKNPKVSMAVGWDDLSGFKKDLSVRLLGGVNPDTTSPHSREMLKTAEAT